MNTNNEIHIPKVFICYSHDSPNHKEWVVNLAKKLIRNGVDVIFDQWDLRLGDDIAKFMERGVAEADRVLMICTESYVRKADTRKGGVGYEAMIVTGELVSGLGVSKFIPIIKQKDKGNLLPKSMSTRVYLNLSEEQNFDSQFELLLREIYQKPPITKPPLGKMPFSKTQVTNKKASFETKLQLCENEISGLWQGDYGLIKLVQNRNVIIGKYISSGQKIFHDIFLSNISGKIVNNTVIFKWDYRGISTGVGFWKIDKNELQGGWWFSEEAPAFSELVSKPSKLLELTQSRYRTWNLKRK